MLSINFTMYVETDYSLQHHKSKNITHHKQMLSWDVVLQKYNICFNLEYGMEQI